VNGATNAGHQWPDFAAIATGNSMQLSDEASRTTIALRLDNAGGINERRESFPAFNLCAELLKLDGPPISLLRRRLSRQTRLPLQLERCLPAQAWFAPAHAQFAHAQTMFAPAQTMFASAQTLFASAQAMFASAQAMFASAQALFAPAQARCPGATSHCLPKAAHRNSFILSKK